MIKKYIKKFLVSFLIVFMLVFMVMIFGPAEIFFANATEFEFVYGEFAGFLAAAGLCAALAVSVILTFCPEGLYNMALAVVFGVSLSGYLQVMFLNKNLDLLGARPDGYQIQGTGAVINSIIWLVVVIGAVTMAYWKPETWNKVMLYGSVFLLCIQSVAWVSLMLTANDEAYTRKGDSNYHLSGREQYTVSADKNIILIILDYFSNEDLKVVQAEYPDLTDYLNDFTFYSNADCNYYGTFPSIAHFLSGQKVDMSQSVNEWLYSIWNNEETQSFYDMLHKKNYKTNLYTPDLHHLCGTNDPVIMMEEFSNMVDSALDISIDYNLLHKTIVKMSCYRMAPDLWKTFFYTRGDEYGNIASYQEDSIDHNNYDFYDSVLNKGVKTDNKNNYFIVQHLMGAHENSTSAKGHYKENATMKETIKGCMVIMEAYLEKLKEAGVYDDAVIIITSDHGDLTDSQVIFYIKESGEKHDVMQVTNAPISLAEMRATIAKEAGEDYTRWGKSIHDFAQDEQRERTVWIRGGIAGYPFVPHYAEDRDGNLNVWQGYTYTGDMEDLYQKLDEGADIIVPMVDSFY